jgi:hypothetical protein
MADKKITALTALVGADVADTDVFAVVDVSATETKKITAEELATAIAEQGLNAGGASRVHIHGIHLPATHNIEFEGATNDGFETVLTVIDPTAHRTVSLPDATGTVALTSDLSTYAPLASPTFTGTPTLPTGTIATTQAAADNSTKIATTAYADSAASTAASAAASAVSLDNLSDVTITSVSSGQLLSYNGSAWVNSAPTGSYNPVEAAVFS